MKKNYLSCFHMKIFMCHIKRNTMQIENIERLNGLQVLKYYLKADWHYILLLLPVKPVGLYLGGKYPLICNLGKKHHLPSQSNHCISHSSSHWHF